MYDQGKRQESKPVPDHGRIVSRRYFGWIADAVQCTKRARGNDCRRAESGVDEPVTFQQIGEQEIASALPHGPAQYEGVAAVDPYRVELLQGFAQAVTGAEELPEIEFLHREPQGAELCRLTLQPLRARRCTMVERIDDDGRPHFAANQSRKSPGIGTDIERRKV